MIAISTKVAVSDLHRYGKRDIPLLDHVVNPAAAQDVYHIANTRYEMQYLPSYCEQGCANLMRYTGTSEPILQCKGPYASATPNVVFEGFGFFVIVGLEGGRSGRHRI